MSYLYNPPASGLFGDPVLRALALEVSQEPAFLDPFSIPLAKLPSEMTTPEAESDDARSGGADSGSKGPRRDDEPRQDWFARADRLSYPGVQRAAGANA